MQTFSIGYTWPQTSGLIPIVLSASYSKRRMPQGIRHTRLAVWALDYSFLGGMLYRVYSAQAPWRKRHAQEAHLYRPGIRFWEDPSKLNPPVALSAHITFIGGEQLGLNRLLEPSGYARFTENTEQLGSLLRQTAEIGQNLQNEGFPQAQALFWQMLNLMLGSIKAKDGLKISPKHSAKTKDSTLFKSIETYFEQNLHKKITRSDLARAMNMSISSLSHQYRAETGMAPMTRLMHLRINLAKRLLLRGMPLKQIAEDTGFTDQFHLSRTFKNLEGVAPRVFLNNITGRQLRMPSQRS